jgi:hypothetical protein
MKHIALITAVLLFHAVVRADAVESCPVLPSDAKVHWKYVRGPDFDVCYALLSNPDPPLFGVYLGNFPDFHQGTLKPIGSSIVAGRTATWYVVSDPKAGHLSREAVISLDQEFPAVVHIWINADSQARLDEALSILARMKLHDAVAP